MKTFLLGLGLMLACFSASALDVGVGVNIHGHGPRHHEWVRSSNWFGFSYSCGHYERRTEVVVIHPEVCNQVWHEPVLEERVVIVNGIETRRRVCIHEGWYETVIVTPRVCRELETTVWVQD